MYDEFGYTYLTFFMMFPQVTITFSGSFFEGWDTVGFAYLKKNIMNISFLTDSHIGLPRSVLSEAAGRDPPETDAEEQRQGQHPPVAGRHHSVPLCVACSHSASYLSLLLDPGPELSQRNRKYCFCHSFIFWQTKLKLLFIIPKFLLLFYF